VESNVARWAYSPEATAKGQEELEENAERVVLMLRHAHEQKPPGHQGMSREAIRTALGVGKPKASAVVDELLRQGRARFAKFKKSRDVGAFIGFNPRQDQSGDIDKQLGITKAGDTFLRRLAVTSAHFILGPFGEDSDLRRWGLRLAQRGGKNAKKRAVVAVARKLVVLMHRLWVTGEEYKPLGYISKAQAA
jgi:transposase